MAAPSIPVLETKRLILRAHRPEDFDRCASFWAEPQVVRYIGGKPFSGQEVWSKILRYAGLWSLLGFGFWVVEEKSSGLVIGELGFADFKRELQPSIAGTPELGWVLETAAHGKGYATEALAAAVEWGDAHFGWKRTVCVIDPGNEGSLRVARKLGYREVEKVTYNGCPLILFERVHGN